MKFVNRKLAIPALLLCLLSQGTAKDRTPASKNLYATWGGVLETDTCASAWVIRRFVDPKAVFRFHRPDSAIREGVQFDTPAAGKYARRPNKSICETIAVEHELEDPALLRVVRVVRDIEINRWGKKITPEAVGLDTLVKGLNKISKNEKECLERSFILFDALYAEFKGPDKLKTSGGK